MTGCANPAYWDLIINLYVLNLKDGQIHEDDAVMELASAFAGPGVTFSGASSEGKLELKAAYPRLSFWKILITFSAVSRP